MEGERERGRQASRRQRSHLSHPIYLIQRLLKTAALFFFRKRRCAKQNQQNKYTGEEMEGEGERGDVVGAGGGGGEGLSDRFALSKICQGDVISLRPTMKVISQSKGISGEPWLLQRPGKLVPVTLFMCEVRQTALSRRQLEWLMIPPTPPINLPAYNPCTPLTFFLTPAIC